MLCPVCQTRFERSGDWCQRCGTYLGLLKRHPRRVAGCVFASILLGAGIFAALAWQVFAPVLRGWPPAGPGPWFWWGFGLATFFLAFGLTARRHLAEVFRRNLRPNDP